MENQMETELQPELQPGVRYHSTAQGMVPFTAEEEEEWDLLEADARKQEVENQKTEVLHIRNQLLKETDWMAGTDVVMTEEWKAYRQALRDVSLQSGFPSEVTWPTKPS